MFEYCKPEDVNVDSCGIIAFLDEMKRKKLHMHAIMMLRHGKLIVESSFEPWSKDSKHMLFSLSKSFTSTAVGFAVQDGLLQLSDRLIDIFPEKLTNPPCENMRKLTVKHMLSMNTGHVKEPQANDEDWEAAFIRSYIDCDPGTHFTYNTFSSFMLSAIVQKVTGKKLVEYLREKLFAPLGMSDDIWTEESPSGVAAGGYGLNVRVSDIAKLGQFYLQKGVWNGERLLNEQWINDAQTPWSDNSPSGGDSDWGRGYGFQFWMCTPAKVFRGDGAFGQYCIICPEQDMVIAINSGVTDMGAVMKSLWDNVLPGVDRAGAAADGLEKRLARTVTPACWEEDGETALEPVPESTWLGSYRLQKNDRLGVDSVTLEKDSFILGSGKEQSALPFNKDAWLHVSLTPADEDKYRYFDECAMRAARVGQELVLHLCHTKTPFEDVLHLSFTPHGITIKGHRNVGFGDGGDWEVIGYRL